MKKDRMFLKIFTRKICSGVTPVNKAKSMKCGARLARQAWNSALAVSAAVMLFGGLTAPAYGFDPVMHNSSAAGSTKYGVWGKSYSCGTCHQSTLAAGANAKAVSPSVQGKTVTFNSSVSYGTDSGHTTSVQICEVCHTQTSHHRYNNSANGANHRGSADCTSCHLHRAGFSAESPGGVSCDGCHNDLYLNGSGYGMHSQTSGMSYKHYMDNALTTSDPLLTGGPLGSSWYATNIPDSTSSSPTARRCLMCHVDHDQFKVGKRAFNLRPNVTSVPIAGMNRDDNLCLSCHNLEKTKAYTGPNAETKAMPIPYLGLSYGNATSILNRSTHGYETTTTYADGSSFKAVCVKCHNDSIGKNGETPKSSVSGQKGTYKFGEHNSTVPGRFSIFSNDFYQRPASGTTLTLNSTNRTVQVVPSPGWTADLSGHYLVITSGTGANQRALITGNSTDTLTLATWPTIAMDNTSSFDVADDNLSIDSVCFNCHSHNGQGKTNGDKVDWYGQQPITDTLEGIYDLFVGDSGTLPTSMTTKSISVTVLLKSGAWKTGTGVAGSITGFVLKCPGGSRTITGYTAGPTLTGSVYSYTLTLASSIKSLSGGVVIMKPSSHPLDIYARHESDERVNTAIGWNKGDQGTTATANSATGATQITDMTKLWTGDEFAGALITFPNLFESGNRVIRTITGGPANTVTWTAPVNGLNTAGGDDYYIGKRHVSCGDCHNTHASFKNPEGSVTTGGTNGNTITDNTLVNVPGWYDNIWAGYLLKVRSTAGVTKDTEQIRFITEYNKATGQYTVSLPFTGTIDNTYSYEVMMGDKWSAAGQSGGRAGSGSSGVWGTLITGGWTTGFTRANGALVSGINLALIKIENVFDNTGTIGGNANAGQRDLCVRCHSYYSYGTATPMTPSGNADGSAVRSTDTAAEFNPNNVAHHAVYARGNNQPIKATGTTVVSPGSYYNTNWPVYSTGTITINIDGTASITGGALRSTVLPGWYVYRGTLASGKPPATATSGWYQITTITNDKSFTVTPSPAVQQTGAFAVTAGLGNSFVPPYGPWSILRCSDCHGSTKTDPVGPHASVNKWLIKDADTALKFEWDNGTTVAVVDYAASLDNGSNVLSTADKAYFCFNCHRADVYGSQAGATGGKTPKQTLLSRASHGQMWVADGTHIGVLPKWPQYCRHCHGGDKIGGIHGSNAAQVKGDAVPQSIRFLNGATWNNGLSVLPTSSGACYTQGTATAVSSCTQHKSVGGSSNTFTIQYPYTGY